MDFIHPRFRPLRQYHPLRIVLRQILRRVLRPLHLRHHRHHHHLRQVLQIRHPVEKGEREINKVLVHHIECFEVILMIELIDGDEKIERT